MCNQLRKLRISSIDLSWMSRCAIIRHPVLGLCAIVGGAFWPDQIGSESQIAHSDPLYPLHRLANKHQEPPSHAAQASGWGPSSLVMTALAESRPRSSLPYSTEKQEGIFMRPHPSIDTVVALLLTSPVTAMLDSITNTSPSQRRRHATSSALTPAMRWSLVEVMSMPGALQGLEDW